MSDVAPPHAPPANDTSDNPGSSPNTATIPADTVKQNPPTDPETTVVTNGPANESPHPDPATVREAGPSEPTQHSADRHPIPSAEEEDEELYGTEEPVQPTDHQTQSKSNETHDNDSDEDPFAGLDDVATMDLYDLANYTFGKKNQECKSRIMQELSKSELSAGLEKRYSERGMRRSVGAVILVHSHNFPHILLLQRSDGKGEYALPGGRLRPGESDEEGLQRKLTSKLRPSGSVSGEEEEQQQLDVGDKLCTWHAIDFARKYYPYVPAHVTKPKEVLNVYSVSLPSKFMFAVPNNLQLVAVPLFELFNNSATYGDIISAVPALLSRYHVNYC